MRFHFSFSRGPKGSAKRLDSWAWGKPKVANAFASILKIRVNDLWPEVIKKPKRAQSQLLLHGTHHAKQSRKVQSEFGEYIEGAS